MAAMDGGAAFGFRRRSAAFIGAPCLLALPLAAQVQVPEMPLAPDGQRGFGAATELGVLQQVLRGRSADDQLFVEGLGALSIELDGLHRELSDHYAARGAFALVGARAEDGPELELADLADLHGAFLAASAKPLEILALADPAAQAFAALYLDTRFRARAAVLVDYASELAELRAGLAVLRGTLDGWVTLQPTEVQNIATRIDLSASMLRAMQKDLEVLRPRSDEVADAGAVSALLGAAQARDAALRRAVFDAIAALETERLELMLGTLFTSRFAAAPEVRAQLDWRARVRARAAPLLAEALVYLPESDAAAAAPPEVAAMRHGDRLRWAERRALEGLSFDPLDRELAFVAAHSADFVWGDIQSRPLYDRFLALSGIRAHDDRTIRGRELTPRELEALAAVQRPFLPGESPKKPAPQQPLSKE